MRRSAILLGAAVVFSLPWSLGAAPTVEGGAVASSSPAASPSATAPPSYSPGTTTSTTVPVAAPTTTTVPPATVTVPEPAADPGIGLDVPEGVTVPAVAAAEPVNGDEYWTYLPGGIPDSFVSRATALDGIESVILYPAGTVHLVRSATADGTIVDEPPRGWFIPLDAAVVTPEDLVTYLGVDLGLGPDDVVLGISSARLRRLAVGDTITFERGNTLRVGAIVEDDVFGESELIALSLDHFDRSKFETRAALVTYSGDAGIEGVRRLLERAYPGGVEFGLHERHANPDSGPRVVRSWVFMKQVFGEFSYRPRGGVRVQIEQAWIDENIVTVDIPLLGRTKCHRKFAKVLTDVMNDLDERGLADIIDRRTFFGCWNPRYIRGTTRLSRHSVGMAADFNFSTITGDRRGSPVHSELLATAYAHGLHSGHVWINRDPGHFEYFGFPDLQIDPTSGPQ